MNPNQNNGLSCQCLSEKILTASPVKISQDNDGTDLELYQCGCRHSLNTIVASNKQLSCFNLNTDNTMIEQLRASVNDLGSNLIDLRILPLQGLL